MPNNIDPNDLELLEKSFSTKKPKIEGDFALNQAQRAIHFGSPNEKEEKNLNTKEIKIKSPDNKPPEKEKIQINISQTSQAVEAAKQSKFSANDFSFIPYGLSYITAKKALDLILKDNNNFSIIQQKYLSVDNLKFIIARIDKIDDLSNTSKDEIKQFYKNILNKKQLIIKARQKASQILQKVKTKQFRTSISTEIQRMIKDSGDLYNYYANTSLIEQDIKKNFLSIITNIDYYIVKKIKELIVMREIDLVYRYREVIDFSKLINTRNIIMENFHSQLKQIQDKKNQVEQFNSQISEIDKQLQSVASNYGKSGEFGEKISRSSMIANIDKNNYFQSVAKVIEPILTKLQSLKLDIQTGNYTDTDQIKQKIKLLNIDKIKQQLKQNYQNTFNKQVK